MSMTKEGINYADEIKKNKTQRERPRFTTSTEGDSLTRQSARKETEIGYILKKYTEQGVLAQVNPNPEHYMDVSNVGSFQESLNYVIQAQADFLQYPAQLRKKFNNDPAEMIDFLANPENKDEAIKLGLLNAPEAPPEPIRVEVTNPATPAPEE